METGLSTKMGADAVENAVKRRRIYLYMFRQIE